MKSGARAQTVKHPLESCFVQVFYSLQNDPDLSAIEPITVGCAFLVENGLICTNAHVVVDALGRDPSLRESTTPPKGTILVAFPFLQSGRLSTHVVAWAPITSSGGDAALLTLDDPLPLGAEELPVMPADDATGSLFLGYGFKSGTSFGANSTARIGNLTHRGWFEVIGESNKGFFVQPGFSGGPALDLHRQVIIGMTVAVDEDPSNRVAYVMPTELISSLLPEFTVTRHDSRLLVFNARRARLFVVMARQEPNDADGIVVHLVSLLGSA